MISISCFEISGSPDLNFLLNFRSRLRCPVSISSENVLTVLHVISIYLKRLLDYGLPQSQTRQYGSSPYLNSNSNQNPNSLENFDLSLTRESCCHLSSFTDSSGVPSGPWRSVPAVPSNLFGVRAGL